VQIAIGKQVEAEHGRKIGERPVGLGEVVKPLEQQDGNQGCPNLDVESVLVVPTKLLILRFCLSA